MWGFPASPREGLKPSQRTPGKVLKTDVSSDRPPHCHHPHQPEHTPPPPRFTTGADGEAAGHCQAPASPPTGAEQQGEQAWGGSGAGPRGLEAASRPVPPARSPVTTALSSRAAWSRCCCWARAGRPVPGAAPTCEQQGPRQGGRPPGAGGPDTQSVALPSSLSRGAVDAKREGECACWEAAVGGAPNPKTWADLAQSLVRGRQGGLRGCPQPPCPRG